MTHYLHYEPEDFAADDFFIHWVRSTDIEAETFWQNWLETYPFKRPEVEAARQLVLITQHLPEPEISDFEIQALKESVFERIDAAPHRSLWPFIPKWAVAASVTALLLAAGWLMMHREEARENAYPQLVARAAEQYDLIEVKNMARAVRVVNLPDGSSVILKKGSMLSYPNQFGEASREVYLTGEGFFEIARNPQKPFFVHANAIVTKVLGTSFHVQAYPGNRSARVTVTTGRVAVYKATEDDAAARSDRALGGLVLSAREQAVFSENMIRKVENSREPRAEVALADMLFEYEEKPVEVIFADLEKAYGITIVYESTVIGKCPVTASLTGEPLPEKLKLVCKAVRAEYETINGQVVISGEGCD